MEKQSEKKWYQKPTAVVLLLILFFPVGLFLMWKHEVWSKTVRWIITGVFAIAVIANAGGKNENTISNSQLQTDPCENMDSYNQGLSEGRTQRGILTDCATYYPYAGWADNYDCWCKGFIEGKK